MKVIKVKVKTILLSFFIFFITIPYVFYVIGLLGFQSISTVGENPSPYTVGFLKIYEKWPTIKLDMGKTYYMIAKSNYNYRNEYIYPYAYGIMMYSQKTGNMEQALIAKEYFKKGIDLGEDDKYYVNNLNALINLEMALGDTKSALDLINKSLGSTSEEVWAMGKVNEMVYLAKNGQYHKALEICNNYVDKIPVLNNYKDTIYYLMGNIDEIKTENSTPNQEMDLYGVVKSKSGRWMFLNDIDFISKVDTSFLDTSKAEGKAELTGTITLKGKPIPNCRVLLKKVNMWPAMNFMSNNLKIYDGEFQIAYTNEMGEYTFPAANSNIDYDVMVAIPSAIGDETARRESVSPIILKEGEKAKFDIEINSAININEVKTDYKSDYISIKYDKVPGATSYGVNINIDGMVTFIPNITDKDEIKIPLTNGALQSFNIGTGAERNGEIVTSPESYLGVIDKKEAYIDVVAYDNDGKIISRTFKQHKITFKKKKLNQGEELILNWKIDEGYTWLKEALEKEPNNKEYIYPLMRIAYERGDKALGDELINRLEEINKTGFDKAFKPYIGE